MHRAHTWETEGASLSIWTAPSLRTSLLFLGWYDATRLCRKDKRVRRNIICRAFFWLQAAALCVIRKPFRLTLHSAASMPLVACCKLCNFYCCCVIKTIQNTPNGDANQVDDFHGMARQKERKSFT